MQHHFYLQETWYRQLGDKIKNELRNEKRDPVVLARKRKYHGGDEASNKAQTTSHRGVINWEPPAIDGEDDHSNKAHLLWMQKEYRKKSPNMDIVRQKMHLTFSFRRKLVNSGHSLKDIDGKYPFLFESEQVCIFYIRCMQLLNILILIECLLILIE
jgi:hypothetical protein